MAQAGRWERRPALPPPRRTAYRRRDAGPGTSVMLDSETWDEVLRGFLADIVGRRLH